MTMTNERIGIIPIDQNGIYTITLEDVMLKCTAENSGRITELSCLGRNVLTDATVNPFNFGSTFWTSPQSDWDWPPPSAVDSDSSWEGRIEDYAVVFTSKPCDKLNIVIEKRISTDASKGIFVIDYSMTNISNSPRSLAPWEISRVKPKGLTFFPHGKASYPPQYQEPLRITQSHGITWFEHNDDTVTGQHKLFADGLEGWIAHVDEDLLFLKTFEDQTDEKRAPGEAEIEIYAVKEYVEVEQQGAYESIAPGETKTWTVKWRLLKLPKDINASLGNEALVSLVRSFL